MIFRKTTVLDIPEIMAIINDAKAYMKRSGIDQWQNGYPAENDFLRDIQNGIAYVIEENKKVIALSAITFEHEIDYDGITEGKWISSGKYAVIHRIAVKSDAKGHNVARVIIDSAERLCRGKNVNAIRSDTHEDNISMQKMLKKNGFSYCGVVWIENRTLKRIGFEKILT